MEEAKEFQFERFVLSNLEFYPRNVEGELQYELSLNPERREDDEANVRIIISIKLTDEDNPTAFFSCENIGYYTVGEDFGEFNMNETAEKEMIELVLEDIKNTLYILSIKVFDRPMIINFDLDSVIEGFQKDPSES